MLLHVELAARHLASLSAPSLRRTAVLSLSLVMVAYARAAMLHHTERQRPALIAAAQRDPVRAAPRCTSDIAHNRTQALAMRLVHCCAALGGAPTAHSTLVQLQGALPSTPDPEVLLKARDHVCMPPS